MENYLTLSYLNDFIFCPRSIYFHGLYQKYNVRNYKQTPQIEGDAAHKTIDEATYSTKKDVLQGIEIYSEKYKICGKIDVFDISKKKLVERKREVKTIYDGYIFQVYAQYHCLIEMGYEVESIVIHDLVHNKNYPIPTPKESKDWQDKFEQLLKDIRVPLKTQIFA